MLSVQHREMRVRAEQKLMEPRFNAERMDRLMREMDLSDGDLAEKTGLSRSMIYYLRKGKRSGVSGRKLQQIAEALNTTADYLLRESEEEDRGEERFVPVVLPESIRRLVDVMKRLSSFRQEELLRYAETMEELDRERRERPLDRQAMEMLIEMAERLQTNRIQKKQDQGFDVLSLLEALMGRDEETIRRFLGGEEEGTGKSN